MGDGAEDAERQALEEQNYVIDVEADLAEATGGAELVIREEREALPAPQSVLPSAREWEATMAVAREISNTQFVPESYRGKPDAVVAAILTGREMGIGPMQSLRQIHMIDGRPSFSADLMMAKMRAGGVVVLETETTEQRAWIKARRKDTGEEAEVEWTTADAEKAGLLSKRNWKTYPGDMLWARAVGRLARRLGSDLLGGLVYSKEEMEDWDDGGYGGSGFDATTTRQFDPETDLAPGVTPKDAAKTLVEIDPNVEWSQVLDQIDSNWRSLSDRGRTDFYRRLANAATKMGELVPAGSLPPISDEQIVSSIAYAFSGAAVDVVRKEPKPSDATLSEEQVAQIDAAMADSADDVPFGYENPKEE